jgi:putative transposase
MDLCGLGVGFWEDRYHTTAIESRDYLAKCIIYIDINMGRAAVVSHPAMWRFCG